MEYLRLAGSRGDSLPGVAVEGIEHLEEARRAGRGVVLVTAHIGNWEAGLLALARLAGPVRVVTGTQFHPRWTSAARSLKEREGISVSARGEGIRPLLGTLARNGIVALLVDGDVYRRGEEYPFLGSPTRLPSGPARLALRTGSPVVAACIVREGPWRFRIRIAPPLGSERQVAALDRKPCGAASLRPFSPIAPWKDPGEVRRLAEALYAAVGAFVIEHIDQWCLFRPLWPDDPGASAATSRRRLGTCEWARSA